MALLPKVKLKALPTFPSTIYGGIGIEVSKTNGALTVDMDWSEFGAISAIPTQPTSHVLTYDTATNSYVLIPSDLLGGAVAGIADAPTDGTQYGRQGVGGMGTWTPVVGGTAATVPPLMDGTVAVGSSIKFAREDHRHPTDTTRLGDAPNDGTLYARKSATWTAVPAAPPAGISDAPNDGQQYARQSLNWSVVASAGYVPIYGTRALAVAATIPAGTTYIRINGYSTAGDGGNFDAVEIANSGTLQAWQFQTNSAGRRWQIANVVINPRMLGAVVVPGNGATADGVRDDTAALQACINMRATNGNITIYIPPIAAAWRCTSRLTIANSMTIHGDGMPGTYANTDPTGQPVYPRQPGSWILF